MYLSMTLVPNKFVYKYKTFVIPHRLDRLRNSPSRRGIHVGQFPVHLASSPVLSSTYSCVYYNFMRQLLTYLLINRFSDVKFRLERGKSLE